MGNSGVFSISVRRKTTRLSGVWRHANLYISKRQSCSVTCKAGTWRRTALCILNPGAGRKPHAPAALPPRNRPGTNGTGGCMGLGAGLDGSGKYRQYRVSNPGPTSCTDYCLPVVYRYPAQSDSSLTTWGWSQESHPKTLVRYRNVTLIRGVFQQTAFNTALWTSFLTSSVFNFACCARPHQDLDVLARDVWSVICTVQWDTDRYNYFNFRFSPCIIIVNHFYCPTNALNYTKLRV